MLVVLLVVLYPAAASSSTSDNDTIPLITPPVEAAAPEGLTQPSGGSSRRLLSLYTGSDIRDRFFSPTGGPTNLFDILSDVDGRLQGLNQRIDVFATCFRKPEYLVPYHIMDANQTNITLYAQCAEEMTDAEGVVNGFALFARYDNTVDLYVYIGDATVAARVLLDATLTNQSLPTGNLTTDILSVRVWYGVGVRNRNGSHALALVYAEPSARVFEMSTGGRGIGFCGLHLQANTSDTQGMVWTQGSPELGSGCDDTFIVCTTLEDLTQTVNCSEAEPLWFLPHVGRQAFNDTELELGASSFPGGEENRMRLTFDDTEDMVTRMGPIVVPEGVFVVSHIL
jgi:hypothetical protein